jgi:hypothetical protein
MPLRRSNKKRIMNRIQQQIYDECKSVESDESVNSNEEQKIEEEVEEEIIQKSEDESDIIEETFTASGFLGVKEINEIKELTEIKEIKEEQDKELEKHIDIGNYFIEKSYLCINVFLKYVFYVLKFIFRVSGVYLMWIVLHYGASHLYIQLCVPKTPWGFILSPFMTATPHCQGLRWIVYNAANVINNMWIMFGAWICSAILMFNKENGHGNSA